MAAPRAISAGVTVAQGDIVQASGAFFLVKACLTLDDRLFLAVDPLTTERGAAPRSWRCRESRGASLLDVVAHRPQQVSCWIVDSDAFLVLA